MIIREKSEHGSLFPAGDHKAIGLFNTSACVNQYSFYGRCIGFHVSSILFLTETNFHFSIEFSLLVIDIECSSYFISVL